MQFQINDKKMKIRKRIITTCALTVGVPLLATAAFPAATALAVPLALALPFFTLSYLETSVHTPAHA